MKWFDELVPLDEALRVILENTVPVERTEQVPLGQAGGRVLAVDLSAMLDAPPFDRAAMDGYGLRSSDLSQAGIKYPVKLKLVGSVHAGMGVGPAVGPGECVYVATGAVLPAHADTVIRVEDSHRIGDFVEIHQKVKAGDNISRAGEDIRKGDRVLERGTFLNPARVGIFASQGLGHIDVYAKPEVAIICTGEELAQPRTPLGPGQVYDINSTTLSSLVYLSGGCSSVLTAGDTIDKLANALEEAREADILVISGGSSVGERDHVFGLLNDIGKVLFRGIKIKPGKPTLFGLVRGKPVLALPGYPTSCLLSAFLLLKPALQKMARLPEKSPPVVNARLSMAVETGSRRQLLPVRLEDGYAVPVGKESGAITATAYANGYLDIDACSCIRQDSEVQIVLFE